MATIYTHRSENIFKTYLLMSVFLALVVAIGYVWSRQVGNPNILWIAMTASIIINIGSFWFSDKLVIASSGAHPIDTNNPAHRELDRLVENLAITAGLPKPKVYIVNDSAPNAFATGRNPAHAAVAVTTGLLAILDKNELEGVIAHELSHIGNRDMQLMTVAVVLVGFITMVGEWLSRMMIFGNHGDGENRNGAVSFILVFVLSLLAQLGAFMLQMAVSRRREYLADASAALLTRYPEGLASALRKISGYAGDVRNANSATAHLYIANPFNSKTSKVMHWFSTHPPVADRIKRLNEMAM